MKFLTVAAAIFASTSLAVPTNNHNGGGGCVPRPDPGNSNTSSAPGGSPTSSHTSSGPGTKPTGSHTSSGPGTKPTSGNTSSSPATKPTDGNTGSSPGPKPTGSHTSSGPGTKPTDGHTSSGPGTKPTDGHTSSGPGTKPTGSHTSSVPATTTTGSNTDSHTSSGPSTTSTGHPGPGGGDYCPEGLYSKPQCCATDVLGFADIDCSTPVHIPTSAKSFQSICAAVSKQARCCVMPVAGQAILCSDPIGGHPTSVPGGHPTSIPGSHPTSVPGGHPTSIPGGHPTSIPGGHPTSIPGGHPTSIPGSHPTSVPGHPTAPSDGNDPITFCPKGLYSNLQCCATDVFSVADINCSNPEHTPTSAKSFQSICAAVGKQARCCVIPVAGQAFLCLDPIPPVGHPTSVPVGHPTSVPGGYPTSAPGGNPTSAPGGNPTPVPGHPTPPSGGNKPCPPGLYGNPQCCATDLLGLVTLNCFTPKNSPTSANSFKRICAADGQQAMCCVIPIAGQAVLCQEPPDV
ncbi:hypothetical protein NHJ13734_005818 [Beauveria thailandica]